MENTPNDERGDSDSYQDREKTDMFGENDYQHIVFTEEIPEFCGADSKNYGPFAERDHFFIPNKNAEILIKKDVAYPANSYNFPQKSNDEILGIANSEEDFLNLPIRKTNSESSTVFATDREGCEFRGQYLKTVDGSLIEINNVKYNYKFLSANEIYNIHQIQVFSYLTLEPKSVISKYKAKVEINMDMMDIMYFPEDLRDETEIYILSLDKKTFFEYDERKDEYKPSAKNTARFMKHKLHIISFIDNNQMFWYNEGIYLPFADNVIRELCNIIFEDVKTNFIEEIVKKVMYSTFVNRLEDRDNDLICIENGVLNTNTSEIHPHSPKYIIFNKLPIIHNSEKSCPRIVDFFKEVLDTDDVNVIFELFGFCLYRRYFLHKAFMLTGEGANGKSTFINLLRRFLGDFNIASVALQDLDTNRFSKASLYGKLANLYADLSADALKRTGVFKQLTGEDAITAEQKFRPPFTFVNYATFVYSANSIPMSEDDSDAFFRRWIILPFPRSFFGENADKDILKKLTTEDELSGLLNESLKGLKRLLANGEFSESKSTDETRDQYVRLSDTTAAFAMDCLELTNPDDYITKEEMYGKYCEYCKAHNLPTSAKTVLGKRLPMAVPAIRSAKPKVGTRQEHCWMGVSFINQQTEIVDNSNNQPRIDEYVYQEPEGEH